MEQMTTRDCWYPTGYWRHDGIRVRLREGPIPPPVVAKPRPPKKNRAKTTGQQMLPLRVRIYTRDGGRCRYCGNEVGKDRPGFRLATLDHVIPRSRGGPNSEENLVTSCVDCNAWKGDRTVEQAGMELLPHPLTVTPPGYGSG